MGESGYAFSSWSASAGYSASMLTEDAKVDSSSTHQLLPSSVNISAEYPALPDHDSMNNPSVHGLVAIPIGQFIKVQRDGVHLQTIYAKPNYYLYSFFPRTVSDWNHLPGDTLSAKSLAILKSRIATLQHEMPY